MSIQATTAVTARCDHRDGERRCPSTLLVAVATDSPVVTEQAARIYAMERGWGIGDGERCPAHRATGQGR